MRIKKVFEIVLAVVVSLVLIGGIGYTIFLDNFELFENQEIELAQFKNERTESFYEVNSFLEHVLKYYEAKSMF